MCGFIAQLVEQRTGNAEVTGSNPVEALIFFFQASSFQLLKVTRPSFFGGGGYHPTLKLSGILTFTFIVSLTHRMDNI